MPEKKTFTYTELANILVKEADIHKGYWALFIEFGLAGANVPVAGPKGEMLLRPTAIVPINRIGIQEFGEPNPLTVDAATVNPKPRKKRR